MNKDKTNDSANNSVSLNSEELAKVSGGCLEREDNLGGNIYAVPTSEVEVFTPHASGDDVC